MGLLWKTLVRGLHNVAGLDSPYAQKEYGINWTKQRQKCLERDDYTCRVCGTSADQLDREPAVHHITPRSEFDGTPRKMNALENLVTLCPSCHGTLEGEHTDCDVEEFVSRASER